MPHIVVVDPDPDVRYLVTDILEAFDYTVTAATDGAEAVTQMDARLPDALLYDQELLRHDSRPLRDARQRDPRIAAVPLVLLGSLLVSRELQNLGPRAVVRKPFRTMQLLRAMQQVTGAGELGKGDATDAAQ